MCPLSPPTPQTNKVELIDRTLRAFVFWTLMNSLSTLYLQGGQWGHRRWLLFCLQYFCMEGRARIFHVFCIWKCCATIFAQIASVYDPVLPRACAVIFSCGSGCSGASGFGRGWDCGCGFGRVRRCSRSGNCKSPRSHAAGQDHTHFHVELR